jgi:hypothetical protein
MNALAPLNNTTQIATNLIRKPAHSSHPNILPEIYNAQTNIAIWHRTLTEKLTHGVTALINTPAIKPVELAVSPQDAYQKLISVLKVDDTNQEIMQALCADMTLLVEMFCCLFDLKRAGLRLTVLDSPMCPRFHVDRIPCRLVTTYQGIATQWLEHRHVDRTKLGVGNLGKKDEESGLYNNSNHINQLNEGDVALLKGEYWDDNLGAGLVHRSPPVAANEPRLLLTLDFI